MAAYTNHIGHHSRDDFRGKDTSIATVGKLAAAEKHNNHEYMQADIDRMQSSINLKLTHLNRHYVMVDGELREVDGRLELCDNVRKIYEEEFAAEISEYNRRQVDSGHPERQISDYLQKISDDKQQEVAVEGLIQIGSYDEEWRGLSMESKNRIVPILLRMLEETIKELNKDVNGEKRRFVLAGASLHLDEGSPHIHYIGVPIVESQKVTKGLKKRVKKSGVFTKDTLGTGLQDNVRAKIEPLIQEAFGWEFDEKKTGRNEDREKNTQVNEILKEQIRKNRSILSNVNESIQTIQEYNNNADDVEHELDRLEAFQSNFDALRELPNLIPSFYRQKRAEAIETIEKAIEGIKEALKWAKEVVERLFGYERTTNMPKKERRAPRLDERIKQAEARVNYEPQKEKDEFHW